MKIDFVVLGLPRSGTTWLANWLTTDRTLCLHDPFSDGLPETWAGDERTFGISCTGAYMFPRWLGSLSCPVAVIERPVRDCDASAASIGFPSVESISGALASIDAPRWKFEELWAEDRARALWDHLLPQIRFDSLRYRLLRRMQVQPYMPAWSYVPGVFEEMMRREAGG